MISRQLAAHLAVIAALATASSAYGSDQLPAQPPLACQRMHLVFEKEGVVWDGVSLHSREALEEKLRAAGDMKPPVCFSTNVARDGFGELVSVLKLMKKYHFRIAFQMRQPTSP